MVWVCGEEGGGCQDFMASADVGAPRKTIVLREDMGHDPFTACNVSKGRGLDCVIRDRQVRISAGPALTYPIREISSA